MKKEFLDVFKSRKPIFGMLHLLGDNDEEVMERAKKEISIYYENGVDAVIVENYFGTYPHMVQVLTYLQQNYPDQVYGVNCLDQDTMNFELAIQYGATFVQLDSVAGHLEERNDITFDAFMKLYRSRFSGYVLGGVRFKYQPYLSGRSLQEDLRIGMTRCDAIVVTQDATGQETSMEKIKEFRDIIGNFPLIIGAGMTPDNCEKQLAVGDAAIVGSYFKDTYKDNGEVDAQHVKQMINARNACLKGGD